MNLCAPQPIVWRFACLLALLLPMHAVGVPVSKVTAVPHLDDRGRAAYREFLAAPGHRAFAITPGGTWSWYGSAPSAASVSASALEACRQVAARACVLYAVDDRVVFDEQGWARLWGPYKDRAAADRAHTGTMLGERFPDLLFRDASGRQHSISGQRGRVTIVHFWGSWCPPCRKELPDLAKLNRRLKGTQDVQLVMLQVREDIASSRNWVRELRLKLPLYDSGVTGISDGVLKAVGGVTIPDRELAAVFPSTYVLDKHGIVVFSRAGPISGWEQYLPLLRDTAAHSGK